MKGRPPDVLSTSPYGIFRSSKAADSSSASALVHESATPARAAVGQPVLPSVFGGAFCRGLGAGDLGQRLHAEPAVKDTAKHSADEGTNPEPPELRGRPASGEPRGARAPGRADR